MPAPDYYDRFNPDLLALIPPDARAVLEVGCGAGALAEAYRRINPGVFWEGFETNPDAANKAEQPGRCSEVWTLDLDEAESRFGSTSIPDVDCVVLGDVLEHLRNPWRVLKLLADVVKPGGQVLASIPNVQHWSLIAGLLRGEWEYADEGLLDRTHLRFFTLKSIKAMFADAGLEVFEIRGRIIGDPKGDVDYMRLIGSGVADMFGGTNFSNQAKTYQYIVRAIKPPAEAKPLRIHAIAAEACCARPRIEEPLRMLGTIPGVRIVMQWYNEGPLETGPPDIVIYQRTSYADPKVVMEIVNQGVLIITEWDDDPRSPHLGNIAASDFLPLRACHAVQVSTEALADVVREWNPEVAVFANQVAELPPPREYTDSDCVKIFFGAQNREKDWEAIMPALNRVIRDQDVLFEVIHDRAFFQALETSNKRFTPFCDYTQYRAILRSCDIALLPLEPTPFNRCKSDLKFLECAAEGVAALMSEFAAHQVTPLVDYAFRCYLDLGHFERILHDLIMDVGGRRRTAERAYAYVRDHRLLSQHYRERYEWYQSLLSQKSALDRALLERVPELAQRAHQATRA